MIGWSVQRPGETCDREARRHGGTLDIDPIDAAMMARCIELSRIGAAVGELPIGSLIARRGQIIAESTNEIMRLTDESRHAEIIAIARARNLIGDNALSECTLYSTVEPCPMCALHSHRRPRSRRVCAKLSDRRRPVALEYPG